MPVNQPMRPDTDSEASPPRHAGSGVQPTPRYARLRFPPRLMLDVTNLANTWLASVRKLFDCTNQQSFETSGSIIPYFDALRHVTYMRKYSRLFPPQATVRWQKMMAKNGEIALRLQPRGDGALVL